VAGCPRVVFTEEPVEAAQAIKEKPGPPTRKVVRTRTNNHITERAVTRQRLIVGTYGEINCSQRERKVAGQNRVLCAQSAP